jgi:hypothetical protein
MVKRSLSLGLVMTERNFLLLLQRVEVIDMIVRAWR